MNTIIEIKNISKTYANGFVALDNVSWDIEKGKIVALLGSNGAGKTTLISTICGLVQQTAGTISVSGFDTQSEYREARKKIGLVPQEIKLDIFLPVWEHLKFSRGLFGKKIDKKYMEQVLTDVSLLDKKNSPIMALSGGMQRRVLIAKALMAEPEVLFLDEPTAGVDVNLRKELLEMVQKLKSRGTTIILTTHYLDEAEKIADEIAFIDKGKILFVEGKKKLMQKWGGKKMRIFFDTVFNTIPVSLEKFHLQLSDNKKELVYYYDTDGNPGIVKMLEAVKNAGFQFYDIKTEEKNLEEIFSNLK